MLGQTRCCWFTRCLFTTCPKRSVIIKSWSWTAKYRITSKLFVPLVSLPANGDGDRDKTRERRSMSLLIITNWESTWASLHEAREAIQCVFFFFPLHPSSSARRPQWQHWPSDLLKHCFGIQGQPQHYSQNQSTWLSVALFNMRHHRMSLS